MTFEFDPRKSASNKIKHGIDFIEAQMLWAGAPREYPLGVSSEMRYLVVGKIRGKHWTAVTTYRGEKIRLISARRPQPMKSNAMNETRKSDKDEVKKRPLSITAEEFDAKFDAGEDISDYVGWDHGVLIKPGELSPGQKLSIQMLAEAQAHDDANSEPVSQSPLQVFLPTWAYDRVQHEAIKKGVSEEETARLLIVRQLEQEKVSS